MGENAVVLIDIRANNNNSVVVGDNEYNKRRLNNQGPIV